MAMDFCNCIGERSTDNFVVKLQHYSDALTAFAHFIIPLALIYFIWWHGIFPYKLEIIYFVTFSILCGVRYLTDMWRYSKFSETFASVITNVQLCAAVASWLTVVVLYFVMPKLLSLRENEHLLKNRVEVLSRQKSLMLREVATRRSIVSLIDDIRSTLDGECVVKSTVVGLGQIFDLQECSFWFPSQTNKTLRLSHSLNHLVSVGSAVPMSLPVVAEIFNTIGAVRIPHTCPLVRANRSKCTKRAMNFEAVAIRVPLSFTESDDSSNACAINCAVMVLVLLSDNIRKFHEYDLEFLATVAEQVDIFPLLLFLCTCNMFLLFTASATYYVVNKIVQQTA